MREITIKAHVLEAWYPVAVLRGDGIFEVEPSAR
jgi:hypothetical protein